MIEAKYYVYLWKIKETQEVIYVGKGSGKRWRSMKDRNDEFKKIRKQHECECEIVKYFVDEEEAYDFEKELGTFYKKIGQCKCCHEFGRKGKYVDEETLEKMRPTMFTKGHNRAWNKGMKMSDEFREKCRQRQLGKKQSEETIRKRSQKLKGHKVSQKVIEKNKQRLSEKVLAIEEKTNKILKEYNSFVELAKEKNVCPATVCLWLKEKKVKNGIFYVKKSIW